MNIMQRAVQEFHEAFNHPVGIMPHLPDASTAKARLKWMREELDEFETAIEEGSLEDAYDALIDELYFVFGTAVIMGVDVEIGFGAVHRANMAKLQPDGTPLYDGDGKVVKPEGWEPPTHTEDLEQQMHDARIYGLAQQMAELEPESTMRIVDDLTLDDLRKALDLANLRRRGKR